jgi:hypothetical protein
MVKLNNKLKNEINSRVKKNLLSTYMIKNTKKNKKK